MTRELADALAAVDLAILEHDTARRARVAATDPVETICADQAALGSRHAATLAKLDLRELAARLGVLGDDMADWRFVLP
jgi:hypothetical protein